MKTYYINESLHFDISDEHRKMIVEAGFKFYKQYNGYRDREFIVLVGEDGNETTFPYYSDIFVH